MVLLPDMMNFLLTVVVEKEKDIVVVVEDIVVEEDIVEEKDIVEDIVVVEKDIVEDIVVVDMGLETDREVVASLGLHNQDTQLSDARFEDKRKMDPLQT